jgi:hypothetical protein
MDSKKAKVAKRKLNVVVNNIPNNGIYFDKSGKFFVSNEVVKIFAEHVVDKADDIFKTILQNPILLKNFGEVVLNLMKEGEKKVDVKEA